MKTWRIPIVWKMYGEYEIEADTLKEAVEKAYDKKWFPENREYIDDSFIVEFGDNLEKLRDEYNSGQKDEEKPLKTYHVKLSLSEEYTAEATVRAQNRKEAEEKVKDMYFNDEIEEKYIDVQINHIETNEVKE